MAARAPYNFIPFPNKPLVRYESAAEIPGHDSTDPQLLSGEIQVTVEAETPILVSDGITEFVRNPDGKVVIPGSTMKGLTRANMQILGFGRMNPETDLADRQIFYRTVGSRSRDPLNEYYKSVVNVKQIPVANGVTVSVPENMKAGYLYHEGKDYFIVPALSLDGKRNYVPLPLDYDNVEELAPGFAKRVHVNYDGTGFGLRLSAYSPDSNLPEGWLLKTGKYVGKKNKCYLIPEQDQDAPMTYVPEIDILSYKADYEAKRNSLGTFGFASAYDYKQASKEEKEAIKAYWDLPEDGQMKPMFYAEFEGHIYLGISLFPRIGYKYPLSQGIPEKHREDYGSAVDYPNAILGFADKDEAFKSRVTFGDFMLEGGPVTKNAKIVSGEPKPSYYNGYVKGGKHYNDEDFQLRGYKRYWHKDPNPVGASANVTSELKLIKDGALFHGTLRFKNLHKDELGLLLWSVAGEEDSRMNLGRGKPYGYGRVNITIDGLKLLDAQSTYGLATFVPAPVYTEGDTAAYIESYIAMAESMLPQAKKKKAFRDRDQIKDFFFMLRTIMPQDEASYMSLDGKEFADAGALPTVADYRKEMAVEAPASNKSDAAGKAAADDGDDWAALLAGKFKKL